jgi:5-methylcytosine-specific restriction endonuclease McrA
MIPYETIVRGRRMKIANLLGVAPLAKPLTSEEGRRILERDHYCCQYCGLDGTSSFENSLIMTVDFVVPRAHKGKKAPANLVTACRPCNVIKGRRVFQNLEAAKTYVLERRAELRKDWEARTTERRGQSATA